MKDKEQTAKWIELIREFQAMDRSEHPGEVLRRLIADPLNPRTNKGRLRVNPILALLAATTLLAVCTFLVFSFAHL